MTIATGSPDIRSALKACVGDAIAHSSVLMAQLVTRARDSLQEQARLPSSTVPVATVAQARHLLSEHAGFFQENFPAALRDTMRSHPVGGAAGSGELVLMDDTQVRDRLEFTRARTAALQEVEAPLAEFAALMSSAQGHHSVQMDSNPLSPANYIRAMQMLVDRTGAIDTARSLWMQHLCTALGVELAAEYRRLSEMLREASVLPAQYVLPSTAGARTDTHAARLKTAVDDVASPSVLTTSEHFAARRIATEIESWPETEGVPPVVRAFVLGPWSEVIAHAQSHAVEGVSDPEGYYALVRPLFWSAQPALGRSDVQRLLVTVPSLLSRLRSGLQSIGYPAEKASAFFLALDELHGIASRAPGSSFATRREPRWANTVMEQPLGKSGATPYVAPPVAVSVAPVAPPTPATAPTPPLKPSARLSPNAASQVLSVGVQLESLERDRWVRWELVWVSPKGRLLLFSTAGGDTESISRGGCLRRLAEQRLRIVPDFDLN